MLVAVISWLYQLLSVKTVLC